MPAPALAAGASAQLRDRLLGELSVLARSEDAALWAKRSLPAKNQLSAADARGVETAFQAKLSAWRSSKWKSFPARSRPESPRPGPVDSGGDGNRNRSYR